MKTVKHSVDALLLPKTVSVDGRSYPIRWDFSAALQFMEYR